MTFNDEQFASLQPYEQQMQSAIKANYGYIDSAKAQRVLETLTAAGVQTPRFKLTCGWCVMRLLKLAGKHYFADKEEREKLAAQEEAGCRGAEVTARTVKPQIAIVFEGCPADDTVVEDWLSQTGLRKGPMLRHLDARMITHPRFQRWALDLAEELGIPVQEAVRSGGATNGAPIHLSNQGVPCVVIGLPVRYIHSHYGFATLADFRHSVQLAVEMIRRIDARMIEAL